MAIQLKLRRGTSAQHEAFTGAEGEVTVDTTLNTLRVHDGATLGGFPVALMDDLTALAESASLITYDNTGSGLTSDTVQGAVDEVKTLVDQSADATATQNALTGLSDRVDATEFATGVTYDPAGVALTATNVQDAIDELCTLPPSYKTASYSLRAVDAGGLVRIAAGANGVSIPPDILSIGDVVVVHNETGSSISIWQLTGATLYWAGAATGSRTLGHRGIATIMCVGTNVFVITGQDLS
jgi:hypothetical protein